MTQREYQYQGYTIHISPSLIGFHWSAENSDRIVTARKSCSTVKEAEQYAEHVINHLHDRTPIHVPDLQAMNRT